MKDIGYLLNNKMEQEVKEVQKGKAERPVEKTELLVRILSTDIPGSKNLYIGLARIKGISFSISNALCRELKLDRHRKISSLSKDEIEKITLGVRSLNVPEFMMNRRFDFDTGKTSHLVTTELDLKKDFDLKRMKKTKSYKGIRHSRGLPVRGQRTKSHFRKKGRNKVVGVNKKK